VVSFLRSVDRAHSFLFLDVDPAKASNLEEAVKKHITDLQRHIKASVLADVGGRVRHVSGGPRPQRRSFFVHTALQLSIAGLVGTIRSLSSSKARKQKHSVAGSLFGVGASVDRTTNNVLSLLVGASVELSQCAYLHSCEGVD
jgi:hypothetical protein